MVEGDKKDNTSNSTSVRELGNVSLQCPKLTETNYTTWALMMETLLKAYGIWETIVAKDGVATNEKKEDTLEANDQDKFLMASSNNKTYGKWRGKDFNKEGKESMKWKNNPNARRASTSQGTKDKSKLRCYESGEHEHFAKEYTKWKNKQEESHLIYDANTEPTFL
uniref:Zinc finger, CCHC-type n=1 Tax=Tanacetum cinerariifolium TaxID=118510 RepID=A0A6L2P6Z4_TANCI|nr:zinc finger, CCHC-type [Tanacetum cinerariifolium]